MKTRVYAAFKNWLQKGRTHFQELSLNWKLLQGSLVICDLLSLFQLYQDFTGHITQETFILGKFVCNIRCELSYPIDNWKQILLGPEAPSISSSRATLARAGTSRNG